MRTGSMISWLRWLAALAFLSLLPSLAQAQCTVSVSDLDFGQINLNTTSQPTGTASVNVSCTNSTLLALTYRVCINLGGGTGASGTTRRMVNGSNYLSYQLYQDGGYATPWGSRLATGFGNPVTVDLLTLPTGPSSTTLTVYGRIAAGQSSAAGGTYLSNYSGTSATYNYQSFPVTAACTSLANNPTTTSFNVRATVDRTCAVTATAIDFGSRTTLATALNAQGNLSVTCTNGLPYSVSLGNGLWGTAPGNRLMRLQGTTTGPTIAYALYQNSGRTTLWGSAAGQTLAGTGSGATQSVPVYARLESQTTPQAGTYTDTVVVTLTY